jgi:hypothetical protein
MAPPGGCGEIVFTKSIAWLCETVIVTASGTYSLLGVSSNDSERTSQYINVRGRSLQALIFDICNLAGRSHRKFLAIYQSIRIAPDRCPTFAHRRTHNLDALTLLVTDYGCRRVLASCCTRPPCIIREPACRPRGHRLVIRARGMSPVRGSNQVARRDATILSCQE